MKLSTRRDIAAPIESVFGHMTDFPRFERQLRRRGVDVRRLDGAGTIRPGLRWVAIFELRGRSTQLQAQLAAVTPPEHLKFDASARGVNTTLDVELIALSRGRTRIKVGLELRPRSLPARLFVQSLKFRKATLERRFEERIAEFARDIEARRGSGTPLT